MLQADARLKPSCDLSLSVEGMTFGWADVEDSAEARDAAAGNSERRQKKSSYVPPHLRSRSTVPISAADVDLSIAASHNYPPPKESTRIEHNFPTSQDSSSKQGFYQNQPGGQPGRGSGWSGNRIDAHHFSNGQERVLQEPSPFPVGNENTAQDSFPSSNVNTGINFDAYEDIPVEISGQDVPPPITSFGEADLGPLVMANVEMCKYTKPTPVQRHAIPISMAGRDLMACAQTGSGKTAAFCFPIVAGILKLGPPNSRRGGYRKAFPLALVLAPTRELAIQVG